MVGQTESQRDAMKLEKLSPKGGCESGIPVRDYSFRHSMQFEDIGQENLGNRRSCVRVGEGEEVAIFSESVNHHEYY
jgi:hypothetical protein